MGKMEDKTMHGIGRRIQKCREDAKMTQEQLAEKVGISWNYLGAIERETKTPKLETLIKIVNALGVSADDVLLDVIDVGLKARCTKLEERIRNLPEKEQKKVLRIIDVLIEEAEK